MKKINGWAVSSLLYTRVVYAINWFNIASIFSHIASDFKQDISLLGLLSTSFLIGVGLFQVPGGIIAAIQGARRTAIYGIIIASLAAFLCGLSSQLQQIEILRFVVGLGMALFFGSSVTLITRYLGRGSEGFAVALLNSAHSIGGIIGIFGWVILAEVVGWRQSLLLSGAFGLISSIFLIVFLPSKHGQEGGGGGEVEKQQQQSQQQIPKGKHSQIKISDIRKVLFDKSLFAFGLVLLGAQIAWGLPLTFIVFYLEDYLKVNSSTAGFIAGLGLISGVVSAPVFGRIYDKTKNIRKLLFVCGLAMSAGVAGFAITTTSSSGLYIAGISNVLVGVFSAGVFTIAYTSAKEAYRKSKTEMKIEWNIEPTITKDSYDTLAIGWVNGLSLFGAFWVPILFSFVVQHVGYAIAWLLGGIFSLLFILPSIGITTYKVESSYRG
ncbi:MAG: MFS transporter [Nitrososphaeraceae archaeon]